MHVLNGLPRRTETCVHVHTTSLWGVRLWQNGQLELRRRRREGQRDLHTAISIWTHQAEFCWKTTRTSCQQPRCQKWQYELVSAHISHTLPFVAVSCSSILNVLWSLLFFFFYRSIKQIHDRTYGTALNVIRLCTTIGISHKTERWFAWALAVTLSNTNLLSVIPSKNYVCGN